MNMEMSTILWRLDQHEGSVHGDQEEGVILIALLGCYTQFINLANMYIVFLMYQALF